MANWKQTLEPYIKVQEIVKTVALNPTAGENLIIGVALISDAGPCTPTLISGQREFREVYSSKDITEEYINSLNDLYTGKGDKGLAAQMWANAYRLAGSTTMLVVRAGTGSELYLSKPLNSGDQNTYILRDGELLKKSEYGFTMKINDTRDGFPPTDDDGWAISIEGVGIFGNRTTDDGFQCDYLSNNLPDLVAQLNDTTKFFCPDVTWMDENNEEVEISIDSTLDDKNSVKKAIFNEVYFAHEFLDKSDDRTKYDAKDSEGNVIAEGLNIGFINLTVGDSNWEENVGESSHPKCSTSDVYGDKYFDLNSNAYSGFKASEYYATNVFNSATDLKVRIRRFNHDAVTERVLEETSELTENGQSPYVILKSVLDTYTAKGTKEPKEEILYRDFFEVAVLDPKLSENVILFNVGNISGRGDMRVDELNDALAMINLVLPEDLHELGLDYYGYDLDNYTIKLYTENPEELSGWKTDVLYTEAEAAAKNAETGAQLGDENFVKEGDVKEAASLESNLKACGVAARLENTKALNKPLYLSDSIDKKGNNIYENKLFYIEDENSIYTIVKREPANQIFADLTIDPKKTKIISVSDTNLQEAMDKLAEDEIYTVEGLCDLGNTQLSFQNYLANLAINENYFYPISTVNSTNYLTIANNAKKISQDSYKLYMSSPWDIDSGTLGWRFFACPGVLYWEQVSKNRRNNEEFRPCFGQNSVAYQSPVCEFNKKTRQLLLSRKVNTVKWDTQTQAWNMNDNYTKQNEDTIMNDESNSRLAVRLSKSIPVLLRQYIGKKISEKLCKQIADTVDYWIRTDILSMTYTIEDYKIKCEYDPILARKNKVKVVLAVRFSRALKYIDVLNYYFDTGVELSVEE